MSEGGTRRSNVKEKATATGDEQIHVTWSAFVDAKHASHGIPVWKDTADSPRIASIDPVALLCNMCAEPKDEKHAAAIVEGFWALAGVHVTQCGSSAEHRLPVPPANKALWRLPVEWLLLFVHFACSWKSDKDKEDGEWFWDRYLRPPKRGSTMEALFQRIGLDFAQQLRTCRSCLAAMHITDPAGVILQLVPPLAVDVNMKDGDGKAVVTPASIAASLTKDSVEDLPSVLGQDTAVEAIADLIDRRLFDLVPQKPSVVLMPGPAATGKTTMAEAVVRYLYGDAVWRDQRQRNLVFLRVDLNEYANESALTRLIGADAGYILSDKSPGILIAWLQQIEDSQMTDRPISGVLLLDELEKAGSEAKIMQFLMSLAEYGSITGANSHRAYLAKKLLIFCATNAGEQLLAAPHNEQEAPAVFDQRTTKLKDEVVQKCCSGQVSSYSRFDLVVPFYGFSVETRCRVISNIVRKRLEAANKIHGSGVFTLSFDNSLIQRMDAEWCAQQTNGARSARNFSLMIDNLAAQASRAIRTDPRLIQHEPNVPVPMEIIDAAAAASSILLPVLRVRVQGDQLQCVLDAAAAHADVKPIAQLRVRSMAASNHLPPLHAAAARGTLLPPQNILPADLNSQDSNGWTPLHHAAAALHVATVRHLLNFFPNLLPKDGPKRGTALMLAVSACDGAEDGAAVEQQLQRVCEVVSALLEHAMKEDQDEAMLNARDDQGRTALLLAFDTHVTRAKASEAANATWRKLVSILLECRMSESIHYDDMTDLPSASRYQLDEDYTHRGMLFRLLQYWHDTETSDAMEKHSFTSFFVEPALTDRNSKPFVFDFLVAANGQLDAILSDPVLGCCLVCVSMVLRTLQKYRCVHRLDACQTAVARTLMRWLQERTAPEAPRPASAAEDELARWNRGKIASAAVLEVFFAHGFSVSWLHVESLLRKEGAEIRRVGLLRALNEFLSKPRDGLFPIEQIDRLANCFGNVQIGTKGRCGSSSTRDGSQTCASAMNPVRSSPLDLFSLRAFQGARTHERLADSTGDGLTLTQQLLNELCTYLRLRQPQLSFDAQPGTWQQLLPALLALHRPAPLPVPEVAPSVSEASMFSRPQSLIPIEPSTRDLAQSRRRALALIDIDRHKREVERLSEIFSLLQQGMEEPHRSYWSPQIPAELRQEPGGGAAPAVSSAAVPAAASAVASGTAKMKCKMIGIEPIRDCINKFGKEYINRLMEDLACAVEKALDRQRPAGETYSRWRNYMSAVEGSLYMSDKGRPPKVVERPMASTGDEGNAPTGKKRKASASRQQNDSVLAAVSGSVASAAPAAAASSEHGLLPTMAAVAAASDPVEAQNGDAGAKKAKH